jgi:leucyl-tRNA synthetase
MGLVTFTEPFPRLMNQGQVIYGGASMSKSKGNVVEPMPIVERWGADTMRLTMLFAGPFEDDIDWKLIAPKPERPPGVRSWLGRVHAVVFEAAGRAGVEPESMVKLTHRTIETVTDDMDRFRYNVAISKLMVLTNEIRSTLDGGGAALAAAEALTLMLAPLAPFLADELWREALGHEQSVHVAAWPAFDPALAREERVTLVVQVDGKVRDRLEIDPGASEDECREAALASRNARRAIDGRDVAQVIVRAPRLVNLVTAR